MAMGPLLHSSRFGGISDQNMQYVTSTCHFSEGSSFHSLIKPLNCNVNYLAKLKGWTTESAKLKITCSLELLSLKSCSITIKSSISIWPVSLQSISKWLYILHIMAYHAIPLSKSHNGLQASTLKWIYVTIKHCHYCQAWNNLLQAWLTSWKAMPIAWNNQGQDTWPVL